MINILRTKQVRAAQKGIPTGLVYKQNEKTLSSVGSKSLEKMLRMRDWTDIAGLKVNRREMEALRVAEDLQTSGVVMEKDMSIMYDNTPAANKVDRKQIEGGNMLNVILQALEKRLKDGTQLSGAETSAAMMASDFLIERLNELSESPQTTTAPEKAARYERYFDTDDEFMQDAVTEDDQDAVLFGGGGIKMNNDDDYFSGGLISPTQRIQF
jgi:hypothetical protein